MFKCRLELFQVIFLTFSIKIITAIFHHDHDITSDNSVLVVITSQWCSGSQKPMDQFYNWKLMNEEFCRKKNIFWAFEKNFLFFHS